MWLGLLILTKIKREKNCVEVRAKLSIGADGIRTTNGPLQIPRTVVPQRTPA